MSTFKLQNQSGAEIDLGDRTKQYFYNVEGLGHSRSASYGSATDWFFSATESKGEQGSVTGSIVFLSNALYRSFISFFEKAEQVRFAYCPTTTWYYTTCELKKLSKDSVYNSGAVVCSVEFTRLTPWAKQTPVKKSIAPEGSPLTIPFTLPATLGGATSGASVEFTIAGDMEGAYTLSIPGAISGPSIILYKYEGGGWVKNGKIDLGTDISAGDTLVISTVPGDSYIENADGSLVANIDITENAFARPVIGKNKLEITSTSAITTNAELNIYDYYVSV